MDFLKSISRRENLFIDKWHFGNIVAFMDLYIFKGNIFFITGKTIIIYVTGVLKKDVRINTEALNFLENK